MASGYAKRNNNVKTQCTSCKCFQLNRSLLCSSSSSSSSSFEILVVCGDCSEVLGTQNTAEERTCWRGVVVEATVAKMTAAAQRWLVIDQDARQWSRWYVGVAINYFGNRRGASI
ncbi:unnamed protein product [Soboliphyme baturini]|uniref:Pentatricopeptide repeat-containing protein n=1 Tax=Soboliphyme baturini TaxID=241478 RepID=A0A183II07_9BILA|nr:unnamed protein product [Soboliphyme baturini]